jgi:two-component system, NtrC family, nitrogen regulation sensor histidine kinase NtrY
MGFDRRFALGLAARIAAIALALGALAWAFDRPELIATKIVTAVLAVASIVSLWRYVRRTNQELARFVEALRYGDLSQSFGSGRSGAGFETLAAELDASIRRLREERATTAEAGRFHAALIDESPAALLVVDGDRIERINRAARRLFPDDAALRIADYGRHGEPLLAVIGGAGRRIASIEVDGRPQRAVFTGTTLHRLGRPLRLLTIQPLHGELDAVELAAQADLVRVLTHEIMNSMTPVTSLAQTVAALMADIDDGSDPARADARAAADALARRAQGIMHFVEGYRDFIRSPSISRRRFDAKPWAGEMAKLFAASPEGKEAEVVIDVAPQTLSIDGDADLLAQSVLNLMKNGAEAAIGAGRVPHITLAIKRSGNGRITIAVGDNGPGIPSAQLTDIFLPFYTTKAAGTGIGLSLVRRISAAHGGFVSVLPNDGGALIEITIPSGG